METLARPDLVSLAAHIVGTALFGGVFAFLYRDSRSVYFSYWALAWWLLSAGLSFYLVWAVTGRGLLLLPYALLELAFAVSLIFAGASVSPKSDMRLSSAVLLLPVVALAGYAVGVFSDLGGFYVLHNLLLTAAFGWNFLAFRRRQSGAGTAGKLFSAALLGSSVLYAHYALVYSSVHFNPSASIPVYLRYHDLYDLVLQTLLAFSAMMLWMEMQHEQLRQANTELKRSRQEIARHSHIDPLTGLSNRAALDETCEANEPVSGVVAVIDLDNFKDVNDALGHLAGDEVLTSVGHLIRTSVRKEDRAWRWGGDEFVLLFRDQTRESVEERLRTLAERLLRFRLRGKGVLPVNVSWGTAELTNGSLREALEQADHQMYLKKRDKVSPSKFFGTGQAIS